MPTSAAPVSPATSPTTNAPKPRSTHRSPPSLPTTSKRRSCSRSSTSTSTASSKPPRSPKARSLGKPNDPFALAVLGDAQLALGNYDQAGDAYRDILNREPGLATFSRYAILLDSLGDIDGAVAMWRNAIANDGSGRLEDAAWANAQLGHLLVEQGRFAEAEGAFQDSLAVVPDYVHALAGLAEVHVARADYDRAVDLYLQVTDPARNPDPSYVIDLGDLYAATGQDDQAARQYAFVETIDGSLPSQRHRHRSRDGPLPRRP